MNTEQDREFFTHYINQLSKEETEVLVVWRWGDERVFCAIGSQKGGEAWQVSDPLNPYTPLAPQEP